MIVFCIAFNQLEILELINNHRLSLGLNPLEDMSIIKSVAYSHTDYMVDKDEVSHHNFFTRSDYLKSNAGAKKVSRVLTIPTMKSFRN